MPATINLAAWANRYPAGEAWIFGKGPSIDVFDFARAGHPRLALNAAAWVVPQCDFAFAHDPREVAEPFPAGCAAVIEPKFAQQYEDAEVIVPYTKRDNALWLLALARPDIVRLGCLFGHSGTVHSALHFAWLLGCTRAVLVGFDCDGGHARAVQAQMRPDAGAPDTPSHYRTILDTAIAQALALGMELQIGGAAPEPPAKGQAALCTPACSAASTPRNMAGHQVAPYPAQPDGGAGGQRPPAGAAGAEPRVRGEPA